MRVKPFFIIASSLFQAAVAHDKAYYARLERTLLPSEKAQLPSAVESQTHAVLELLFRIMTSSYHYPSYSQIDGANLNAAITEFYALLNHAKSAYSGNYHQLLRDYRLSQLHLKLLDETDIMALNRCAQANNQALMAYRATQAVFLSDWTVVSSFSVLMANDFSFEDAIRILREQPLNMMAVFKVNASEIGDCVSWVKQSLMDYEKLSREEAMKVITAMILDQPLRSYHQNIAKPFRHFYRKIVPKNSFNHSISWLDRSEKRSAVVGSDCYFLPESFHLTNTEKALDRREEAICQNLQPLPLLMSMGMILCLLYLVARLQPCKKVLPAWGFFSGRKKQQPSESCLTDNIEKQTDINFKSA